MRGKCGDLSRSPVAEWVVWCHGCLAFTFFCGLRCLARRIAGGEFLQNEEKGRQIGRLTLVEDPGETAPGCAKRGQHVGYIGGSGNGTVGRSTVNCQSHVSYWAACSIIREVDHRYSI